jgi:hypothetical protein
MAEVRTTAVKYTLSAGNRIKPMRLAKNPADICHNYFIVTLYNVSAIQGMRRNAANAESTIRQWACPRNREVILGVVVIELRFLGLSNN